MNILQFLKDLKVLKILLFVSSPSSLKDKDLKNGKPH
jgi:hypothetical protein